MPKPVVLVVDDEVSNQEFCRDALELNGYEVLVASDPQEAVRVLAEREVDFVICDIAMPHNGRRMFEYLLQNFPHLRGRFIFVTGNPESKAEVEKLPQAAPCLLKPYPLNLLLNLLKSALRA